MRRDAYNVLRAKGGVDASTVPLPDDKQSEKQSEPESPGDTPLSETSGEKRKRIGTGIERHFDQPMTETQLERANIKLFR